MQIALIVRRSFSVDSFERLWWLMTAFVARYRMDGAILSTIPLNRQLCGNQRCCCCPSTFFVSLCDAARQSIASRSYARPSVRQGENLSSFLQGGVKQRGGPLIRLRSSIPIPIFAMPDSQRASSIVETRATHRARQGLRENWPNHVPICATDIYLISAFSQLQSNFTVSGPHL